MTEGISNKDGTTEQYRSCIGHDTCQGPKSPPCLTREYQDSCPYNRNASQHPTTLKQEARELRGTVNAGLTLLVLNHQGVSVPA